MLRGSSDKYHGKGERKMIVYFTGTGNSRHVAFKIASHMEEEKILSIGDMIKKGETGNFQSETPYVFVMPTYGWRMPRVAEKFIRESKFSGSKKAYFVLTCGDSCGNAGEYARRLCHEKDMEYMGCFQVKMPENYIAMFSVPDEEESERIVKAADRSARQIAGQIKAGEKGERKATLIGAAESSFVNNIFYKVFVKARGFRVADNCSGCGLCADVCVLNNIKIAGGKPVWGENCTHCMACICRCPMEAIEYKEKSKGKRRYYLSD